MKKQQGKTVLMLALAVLVGLGGALLLLEEPVADNYRQVANTEPEAIDEISAQDPQISFFPALDVDENTPPADRSISHISGELPEDCAEESAALEIKLIDRSTGQPITDFCRVWVTYNYDGAEALHVVNFSSDEDDSYLRTAWPSENGLLSVSACYFEDSRKLIFEWAETPIPQGFLLDCDLAKAFAPVNDKRPASVTLYYKKAPTLHVNVKNSKGEPVSNVSLLAVPMRINGHANQSRCRFEIFDHIYEGEYYRTTEDEEIKQEFAEDQKSAIDDLKKWLSGRTNSPFTSTLKALVGDLSGRQTLRDSTARTDANGHAEFKNLPFGDWIIFAFKSGQKVLEQRVTLDSHNSYCDFVLDELALAYVIVDVYWQGSREEGPEDRYPAEFYVSETTSEARLGEFMQLRSSECWDSRYWKDGHIRLRLQFSKSSQWLLVFQYDSPIMIRSEIGKIRHYTFTIQADEYATWTPTIMLGDKEYNKPIDLYRNGRHQETVTSGGPIELLWGSYVAYLPGNIKHEFMLLPDDILAETIVIPCAKVRFTVDKFMAEEIYMPDLMLDGDIFEFPLKPDKKSGLLTTTITITVGTYSYEIGLFKGIFRATEGELVDLKFTKKKCAGLARLKVIDATEGAIGPLTLGAAGDPLWPEMLYMFQPSSGKGPQHRATMEKVAWISETDTVHFLYAPAGKYFLDFGFKEFAVMLPGTIKVTDEMLAAAKKNEFEVNFDVSYNGIYRFHCLHEGGRLLYFDAGENVAFNGSYTLYVWRTIELEDQEVRQFAEHFFEVNGSGFDIDSEQLAWTNLRLIEFEFQGYGDTLDGNLSWWKPDVEVRLEDINRHGFKNLSFNDNISLEPPIRHASAWLADGEYQIVPYFGAPAAAIVKFKVGKNQPANIIVRSEPIAGIGKHKPRD